MPSGCHTWFTFWICCTILLCHFPFRHRSITIIPHIICMNDVVRPILWVMLRAGHSIYRGTNHPANHRMYYIGCIWRRAVRMHFNIGSKSGGESDLVGGWTSIYYICVRWPNEYTAKKYKKTGPTFRSHSFASEIALKTAESMNKLNFPLNSTSVNCENMAKGSSAPFCVF